MKASRTYITSRLAAVFAVILVLASCGKDKDFIIDEGSGVKGSSSGDRKEFIEKRRVVLFYESGFNDLSSYLDSDVNKELTQAAMPGKGRNEDVILVYSKLMEDSSSKPVKSYLRRYSKDRSGVLTADTLLTLDEKTMACNPETMRTVLEFVRDRFPAKGYGLIFSSHGSGWLPDGYFFSPSKFESAHAGELNKAPARRQAAPGPLWPSIPETALRDDPYYGMTRSIGIEEAPSDGCFERKEMSTAEFASGIPYHLDFILFDMCFSSGIEVFYALKDKADYIGGSAAEVLAAGMFDYTRITDYLFQTPEPDLEGLFRAGFKMYMDQSGVYQSSTVMLARTSGMDALAATCRRLFEKYRTDIWHLHYRTVQPYYRYSTDRHYFFDLEDIFIKVNASPEDLEELRAALDGCTVYKAATPVFMDSFEVKTYSGLSCYLPCSGTELLNKYYMEESWNKATELLK